MRKLKLLCLLVCSLAAIWVGFWVVFENPQTMSVNFAGFETPALPIGLWLVMLFCLGCLFGLACGWPSLIRSKKQRKSLERKLMKLDGV